MTFIKSGKSKSMRIVHYCPHLLARESGTANAVRGWCEALVSLGIDVAAVVDSAQVAMEPPPKVQVIPIDHRGRGELRFPRGIATQIESADLLVVHGGWQLGNIVATRAALRRAIPYVITTHGVYNPHVFGRRRLVKWLWARVLERRYLTRSTAVHMFFPEEKEGLERLGVEPRTVTVPNGIAVPERARWDGGSGGYLLWLGRFDPFNKGLDVLLKGLAMMAPEARPALRLHGPDWRGQKQVVQELIDDLDLGSSVTIGDPVYGDEKWDLISRALACAYPSRWDACPTGVAESAAAGVPTLVADYPLGRWLEARDAAILAQLEPSEIAAGIDRLSNDAHTVGEKAAQIASTELAWDAVARSWLDQLEPLLEARP